MNEERSDDQAMSHPMSKGSAISIGPAPGIIRPPFDNLTIIVHWITLLIILALLSSGMLHGQVEERSWAEPLLRFHRSFGVAIWLLTAFRLAWRLTGARFPEFPASMSQLHRLAARLSEYLLYALLLIQPATGVAQSLLRGRPVDLFAWSLPPLLAKDLYLAGIFHEAHEIGAWCVIALAGLHATAALIHHFILRDDVLEAMAPVFRRNSHGCMDIENDQCTNFKTSANSAIQAGIQQYGYQRRDQGGEDYRS